MRPVLSTLAYSVCLVLGCFVAVAVVVAVAVGVGIIVIIIFGLLHYTDTTTNGPWWINSGTILTNHIDWGQELTLNSMPLFSTHPNKFHPVPQSIFPPVVPHNFCP